MNTATFTNGFTSTYKGNRAVKAAWALIDNESNTTINSGYSMTSELAAANGRSLKHCPAPDVKWCSTVGVKNGDYTPEEIKEMHKENREFRLKTRVEVI
jgi:hypothetical protein